MEDLLEWLNQAVKARASDVYLLPKTTDYQLYFRTAHDFMSQALIPTETAQRWINYLNLIHS